LEVETGDPRAEIRGQRSEVGGRKSAVDHCKRTKAVQINSAKDLNVYKRAYAFFEERMIVPFLFRLVSGLLIFGFVSDHQISEL